MNVEFENLKNVFEKNNYNRIFGKYFSDVLPFFFFPPLWILISTYFDVLTI